MKNWKRYGAMVLAVAMMVAISTPIFAAEATIASFVQQLAKVKNLNATDARVAQESLRSVGIRLPSNLDFGKSLTEGDVALISRAAGLRVSTSNPEAAFTQENMDVFFLSFSGELGGETASTNSHPYGQNDNYNNGNGLGHTFDPFSKGKGHGHGKGKQSPSEPE